MANTGVKKFNRDINLTGGARLMKDSTELIDKDGNIKADIKDTLTSGYIYVGNASNVSAEVAMSGDATMDATGAVTVSGTTAGLSVGTTMITGSTTTTSGAGAVAITGSIHEVTTTGTGDALTLVDGAEGQHLNVVYVAEGAGGDTAVLTPTNLAGANTTITFTDLGDSAHLLFTAGAWYFLGGEATVA